MLVCLFTRFENALRKVDAMGILFETQQDLKRSRHSHKITFYRLTANTK